MDITSYGKSRSPFQVRFETKTNSDNHLEITATIISAGHSQGDSHIKWKLPDHWKVIDGLLEDDSDLSKDENRILRITVDAEQMKEKDQAFLFVYRMKNGERYGVSASYVHSNQSENSPKLQKSARKKIRKFLE